jgi:hypothetical protein
MDQKPLSSDVMSAIDACRPGCPDERLPEVAAALAASPPGRVAEVRQHIERFDRVLVSAVQKVPVPEDLADRVLAHLRAAKEEAAEQAVDHHEALWAVSAPDTNVAEVEPASVHRSRLRATRRWLKVAGLAATVLAATILIVVLWPRETIGLAEVHARAREFYESDSHEVAFSSETIPTALGGVASDSVVGWHPIDFLGRRGFAYELSSNRRSKATLYVVPLGSWFGRKFSGLTTDPTPQGTSGMTVAVWSDKTQVYVLVVKDPRAFSSFLPRSVA